MNSSIRIIGRTSSPSHWHSGVPLFWTGSGALMKVRASELTLVLFADWDLREPWIRVELDGVTLIRMPLNRGESRVTVFRGIDAACEHTVQLFREVQCMDSSEEPYQDNCLILRDVEIHGEFLPLEPVTRRLQFIGDSLTSGEGLACAGPFMDWVSCMFSTEGNYAVLTAAELQAELQIVSKSGWGVYSSWDENRRCAVPLIYDKVCGVLSGPRAEELGANEPADPAWQPDAVIINLGTNDGSACEKAQDKAAFTAEMQEAVIRFLTALRGMYPAAELIWVYGMCGHPMEPALKEAVASYRETGGDEKAHYLSLPAASAEEMGSRQHPGRPNHRKAADAILGKLKELNI